MFTFGYCAPTSDSLTSGGLPSGAAVWTPDGSGGGTLVVDVPAGSGCAGGSTGGWFVDLQLTRSGCGKKLQIEVSGTSPLSRTDAHSIVVYDQASVVLQMANSGSGGDCSAGGPWVVTSGTNPCEAKSRCGGATFRTAEIVIQGTSTYAIASTTTVTVVML